MSVVGLRCFLMAKAKPFPGATICRIEKTGLRAALLLLIPAVENRRSIRAWQRSNKNFCNFQS